MVYSWIVQLPSGLCLKFYDVEKTILEKFFLLYNINVVGFFANPSSQDNTPVQQCIHDDCVPEEKTHVSPIFSILTVTMICYMLCIFGESTIIYSY